jgi:hypothetical protein
MPLEKWQFFIWYGVSQAPDLLDETRRLLFKLMCFQLLQTSSSNVALVLRYLQRSTRRQSGAPLSHIARSTYKIFDTASQTRLQSQYS